MQLESHYDVIFVGHNYLSILGALMLRRSGKKVLIVNDPRVNVGDNYFFHYSLLEESLLTAWDRHHGLGLTDFWENASSAEDLRLGWKGAWMSLGSESPYLNFLELTRKAAPYLKLETTVSSLVFDQDYFLYIKEIATKWGESMVLKNVETLLDTTACPEHLKLTLDLAYETYTKQVKDNNDVLHFHLFLQNVLGSRLQFPIHKVQFIMALLKLLSPRRRFNSDSLKALEKHLKSQDVLIKDARVQGWQTKGSSASVLLDSFDGLVNAKRVIVTGEFEANSPLYLQPHDSSIVLMGSLEFTFDQEESFFGVKPFTLVDGEETEQGYTKIMKLFYDGKGGWKGVDYIEQMEGDKAQFHRASLEHRLGLLFDRYFPGVSKPNGVKIQTGLEKKILFLDFERGVALKESAIKNDALELVEELAPGKVKPVHGIQYWGALKSNSLGLFSLLLETKLRFSAQV